LRSPLGLPVTFLRILLLGGIFGVGFLREYLKLFNEKKLAAITSHLSQRVLMDKQTQEFVKDSSWPSRRKNAVFERVERSASVFNLFLLRSG